jgi:hypothetical protein
VPRISGNSGIGIANVVAMTRDWTSQLISGLAGALALTAIHEFARRRVPDAPRMDVLGMRALRRWIPGLSSERPQSARLRGAALAGDLVANTLYYAAVPGRTSAATWHRATALGIAAGAGALLLPQPMGLGNPPHIGSPANQWMTMGWYVAGAVAAAAAANALTARR